MELLRTRTVERPSRRGVRGAAGVMAAVILLVPASCTRSERATGPPLTTDEGEFTVAGLLAEEPDVPVEVSGRLWVGPESGAAASGPAVRLCQSVAEADVPDVPFLECREPTVSVPEWLGAAALEWADPDGTGRARYSSTVVVTGRFEEGLLAVTAVRDGARVMTEEAPGGG